SSCGDLLILLDRSGSMDQCTIMGVKKEAIAKSVLKAVIARFPTIPMGLSVFPDTLTMCIPGMGCTPQKVVIDVAADGAPRIASWRDTMPASCGGTPTGDSLQSLKSYDRFTAGKTHYLLVITDGQPTCQDDLEATCNGMGRIECANPTKVYEAIRYLHE